MSSVVPVPLGVSMPGPRADVHVVCGSKLCRTITVSAPTVAGASAFFKARLSQQWASPESDARPVVLEVTKKQAAVAMVFLTSLHMGDLPAHLQAARSAGPEAAKQAQRDLRALLSLCDYCQAEGVACVALTLLAGWVQLRQHVRWTTITFLLCESTDTIAHSAAYVAAHREAVRYLSWLFSDLEDVLGDDECCRRLASLPYDALVDLMGSNKIRVASEGSIVAAISCWVAGRPAGSIPQAQLRQLASCVRLRGLTMTYRQQVLQHHAWYKEGAGLAALANIETLLAMVPLIPSATITSHARSLQEDLEQQTKGLHRALYHPFKDSSREVLDWWKSALAAPRAASRHHSLTLAGDITQGRLARYFARRHTGHEGSNRAWVGVVSAPYAGLNFTLVFRFVAATTAGADKGKKTKKRARTLQSGGPTLPAVYCLQFGVSFSIPHLPPGSPRPLLGLAPPSLAHPLAVFTSEAGRLATRSHSAEPGVLLLPSGQVLACPEVLPTSLPDTPWGAEHEAALAPFLSPAGSIQVKVAVQPPRDAAV